MTNVTAIALQTINITNQLPSNEQIRVVLGEKLVKLNEALVSNNSVGFDLSIELRYIHASLKSNPSVAYMLTDEEIGILTKGFSKETAIVLISPKVKAPKAAVMLSIDDI